MMIKRIFAFLSVFFLLIPVSALTELDEEEHSITEYIDLSEEDESPTIYEPDESRIITITCTGDFTIGGDNRKKKEQSFYKTLKSKGGDINFTMANVRDIFKKDNLTLVNFEGTFTETKYVPDRKKQNSFIFNIAPEYVNVLTDNYIEAVSLANNHVMDHGEEGYEETKSTLRDAGVIYSTAEDIGEFTVDGDIRIGMISYLCIDLYDKPVGGYDNLYDKVAADIAAMKKEYDIVIASFHWGNELDYKPNERQKKMGRLAVDSGADLVIGHHSHRINPIEEYNGVYICYSLGNFCFSGNNKPSDMSSYLFQTRFRISKTHEVSNVGFRIIPIRITSVKETNNYTPTPITDEMQIVRILNTLRENGKGFGVSEYPLEWK